jgi:diguanylate cyclase (GGDEF)-like protein
MSDKVLVVDDDPRVLEGYQRALRKRFNLDVASGGHQALEMVAANGPYAVIVSDMRMPRMSGLDLLLRIREQTPETVRIMLTGNADQQTAMDAVNQGRVFRFLNKPCAAEVMAEALEQALDQYHRVQKKDLLINQASAELQDLTDQLAYQSQHDALTGLANRQSFEEQLETALDAARKESCEHVLCHINIDHLHVINNSCGQAAGDELLRKVASLVAARIRERDPFARLEGDQFGILLKECSLDRAHSLVEGLLAALNQHRFSWDDQPFAISACIGVVAVNSRCKSVAAALSAAETACNVARDRGRNSIHFGSEKDRELTGRLDEMQWVARVQKALEEDQFVLYFQPIVPLQKSEDGDHFELLIRMQGEEGEIIPPQHFLPAAEHYHLSARVDCWVIDAAVQWLQRHEPCLQRLSLCSINLSGLSVGNQQVLDCIIDIFASSSVPREKICFEITETATIARMASAIEFINRLRREGFRFSLDDFGSGLSSFGYLKTLPVDFLKIDGMFVKNMDADEFDNTVVKSIAEIGRVTGKKTVAEFVENQAAAERLRALGIDYAQGYHFSKPRPLDELAQSKE